MPARDCPLPNGQVLAGAIPVDAHRDMAAGAVVSKFRALPECHQGVNRRPKGLGDA